MENSERPRNVGYLSERQLEKRCNDLQSKIRHTRRQDDRRMGMEIEYCYLYRELEHRKKRKIAHQNFLAKKYDKKYDNRAKKPQKVV